MSRSLFGYWFIWLMVPEQKLASSEGLLKHDVAKGIKCQDRASVLPWSSHPLFMKPQMSF